MIRRVRSASTPRDVRLRQRCLILVMFPVDYARGIGAILARTSAACQLLPDSDETFSVRPSC